MPAIRASTCIRASSERNRAGLTVTGHASANSRLLTWVLILIFAAGAFGYFLIQAPVWLRGDDPERAGVP